ncbi:hypothetical protein EYF80_012011 [Liparis tanakae]|uniref:Uncharacterized protein n=1 Tax=Liparis tanakae TaxID=230148 RepID=A0A4Z2IKK5_9TELE|nr:hypothetical protein EYF80_012011 [Liparis tanakae]
MTPPPVRVEELLHLLLQWINLTTRSLLEQAAAFPTRQTKRLGQIVEGKEGAQRRKIREKAQRN